MKISLIVALLGLAISFALPIFAQQTNKPDPQSRERLVALMKKYDEVFNNNEASALAAFFTEDAVFVTDAGPIYGREAIVKHFADLFQNMHFSNHLGKADEYSPHIIGTAGNELWSNGEWSMTIQGKDWGPKDIKGYWSAIREGDDWKIRMLCSNVTPEPPK
jgi:ketosteroid isomerase-like protein